MLFIERDSKGAIAAIRRGEPDCGLEPVSSSDEEVMAFLRSAQGVEPLALLLSESDVSIVRVLEDLIDLLIAKKVILFTELPPEAQKKIQNRKNLRANLHKDQFLVDDIL
ncbi:MAG: hypothetical protein ACK5PS_03795 [Desulfopila sp.]